MKFTTLALLLATLPFMAYSQAEEPQVEEAETEIEAVSTYDAAKAAAYGADDFGMKSYVMAFLKAGPNRDRSPEEAQALQMAHLKNIRRMAEEGTLVLAGPFMDNGEIRGIYIFNVRTIEEAEALTNTDPAVQAGSLVMELKPWYGTAGLVGLGEVHKSVQKKSMF